MGIPYNYKQLGDNESPNFSTVNTHWWIHGGRVGAKDDQCTSAYCYEA